MLLEYPGLDLLRANLVLQLGLLVVFGYWSRAVTRTYFSAPLILVAAIYFWHSTYLTAHFLVPLQEFQYTGAIFTYGSEFIPQATALVALCMVCTVLGSVYAFHREQADFLGRPGGEPDEGGASRIGLSLLHGTASLFAWTCLAACLVVTAVYLLLEGADTFGQAYMTLYLDRPESLVERLYQSTKFFGAVAVLMVFTARRARAMPIAPLVFSGTLAFLGILMGSRSVPFMVLLAMLVCIDRFVRRLSLLEVAALALLASAASFVIDHTREYGIGLQIFDLARTGRSIDLLNIVFNAGGVIKTVLRTMAFSNGHAALYGRSIADAIVYLLPRPLVDGAGFRTGFVRPSEWLIANSADVRPGEGLGYSLVAESYLNFGYLGCLLFAALGFFVGQQYFRHVFTDDRIAWARAYVIAVVLSLHMRNDLAASLRVLVYGYLLIELLHWIDRRELTLRFTWPFHVRAARNAGSNVTP
jgi:hypothetical protein